MIQFILIVRYISFLFQLKKQGYNKFMPLTFFYTFYCFFSSFLKVNILPGTTPYHPEPAHITRNFRIDLDLNSHTQNSGGLFFLG